MRAAIIDASVAVKWVLPEPYSEQARTLLGALTMYAPAHWQAEAVNGVWKRVHRGQLSADDARECASVLTDAPIGVVPLPRLMERAFDRAMELRITVYDALYLALAETRGLPLISDDRELLRRIRTDPALAPLALHVGDLPS